MANLADKLTALVKEEAPAFNLFLVAHTGSPAGFYNFYVDSELPVTMTMLSEFTRHISKMIDEGEFGERKFTFEMSTPGADRPLADFRQLGKHCGRVMEVETNDGTSFEAKLISVTEPMMQMEKIVPLKGKKHELVPVEINWNDIKKATIKITFN
jgi:ribosome maturation factor RimP